VPRRPRGGIVGRPGGEPRPGEIYIEFQQVGNAVKVTAVDAASGEEVSIMGPPSAARTDLQKLAVKKLKNKLGQSGS
jgi:hypothetical protein